MRISNRAIGAIIESDLTSTLEAKLVAKQAELLSLAQETAYLEKLRSIEASHGEQYTFEEHLKQENKELQRKVESPRQILDDTKTFTGEEINRLKVAVDALAITNRYTSNSSNQKIDVLKAENEAITVTNRDMKTSMRIKIWNPKSFEKSEFFKVWSKIDISFAKMGLEETEEWADDVSNYAEVTSAFLAAERMQKKSIADEAKKEKGSTALKQRIMDAGIAIRGRYLEMMLPVEERDSVIISKVVRPPIMLTLNLMQLCMTLSFKKDVHHLLMYFYIAGLTTSIQTSLH
ncbi:hypothetical protein DID88_000695 [Monilinia fructigena]|uniref:Uncharacterized protein n=1 Tax=Monilinia fructigena TaxID=38457 RepID=A0A395INW7_9HELO|nr:hypothetical protein DID88_000695 [Monilinia fructigena]